MFARAYNLLQLFSLRIWMQCDTASVKPESLPSLPVSPFLCRLTSPLISRLQMIHKRLKQIDDLLGDMLIGAEKFMTTELQRLVGS